MEASGLIIPNEEVRKVENLTFRTLTLSEEVKRESTDQSRFAFFLIQSSISKLFRVISLVKRCNSKINVSSQPNKGMNYML